MREEYNNFSSSKTLGVKAEYSLRCAIVNPTKVANFVTIAHGTKVTFLKLPQVFVLPGSAIYSESKFPYAQYKSGELDDLKDGSGVWLHVSGTASLEIPPIKRGRARFISNIKGKHRIEHYYLWPI